jgi:hypothetical protein
MNIVGVLTAAALLAGQLSTLLHILVVDHQRCPEHGELVHASLRRAPAPANDPLVVGRVSVVAPGETNGDDQGDDHCLSLAHRRDAWVGAAAPEIPFVVPTAAATTLPPADAAPLTRLWMLAPKTSPPTAA